MNIFAASVFCSVQWNLRIEVLEEDPVISSSSAGSKS